jgi:hypothetical protein
MVPLRRDNGMWGAFDHVFAPCHDRFVNRAKPTTAAGLAVFVALTGCASKASKAPAMHRVVGAATPETAALGFDASLRSNGNLKYECLPDNGITSEYSALDSGRPTASATREGARWIVTLSYPADTLNHPQYEVNHRDGGYCVSKILPILASPRTRPSSPAPYSGSATSAPPK